MHMFAVLTLLVCMLVVLAARGPCVIAMSGKKRIDGARSEAENLRESIRSLKAKLNDTDMETVVGECKTRELGPKPNCRRTLQGHYGKVYAMHWAGDTLHLVSASQDGKLIVWNALTTHKIQAIPLRSSWVMTCAYEQQHNRLVACGGLDNLCSIYQLGQVQAMRPDKELAAHDGCVPSRVVSCCPICVVARLGVASTHVWLGSVLFSYLSCCRFIDSTSIVTSSGDSQCIYWDIEKGDPTVMFNDHGGDVMSVSKCPTNRNLFVSGSCDSTAKLWDIRTGQCSMTFEGHVSDINAVDFMSSGTCFGTGSDDSTCRLFDLRSYHQLAQFENGGIMCGITSVSFSASGRLLFAGCVGLMAAAVLRVVAALCIQWCSPMMHANSYDDFNAHAWDILGKHDKSAYHIQKHQNRVSCLGVNSNGHALCTGSWDTQLLVWA